MSKGWYKRSEYFHLWHHILYRANHKGSEVMFNGENIILKPGQFITGRKALATETGINESKIERILTFFTKTEQQIEQQKSNRNRIITVVAWDEYQQSEQQSEQPVNTNRTTSEQPVNTDKKEKNVKKVKNVKNKEVVCFYFFSDENLNKEYIAWIEYRKEIKKKMPASTIIRQLKFLNKYPPEVAIDIIDKSIRSAWQGLFEPKDEFKRSNNKISDYHVKYPDLFNPDGSAKDV